MNSKTPADQYVSLMQSANVHDRLIDKFQLLSVYGAQFRVLARRELEANTRIAVGKRDGFIQVEVDDQDAPRAAAIANAYVEQLRRISAELALTEAQQRRVFFEGQLTQTRKNLAKAQQQLQASGVNEGTMRAEPRSATENYARRRAEVTAAEIRLQLLKGMYADQSIEVVQANGTLQALRSQLARLEAQNTDVSSGEYMDRLREYKYQEMLLELFSKQYEMSRVDESRDGGWIQVVDVATVPERKSAPRVTLLTVLAFFASSALLLLYFVARELIRRSMNNPLLRPNWNLLSNRFGRRSIAQQ